MSKKSTTSAGNGASSASAHPGNGTGTVGLHEIVGVPIGGTVRGDAARTLVALLAAEASSLLHLSAIGTGKLTISAGISPPRIVGLIPKGDRAAARRRSIWMLLPSGEARLHATISPAEAMVLERLQKAGAAGLDAKGRQAFAAIGPRDWTRRIADLRSYGCVISILQIGQSQTITRLHSTIALDTPPNDGLPILEAEHCARLAISRPLSSGRVRPRPNA
jgi:hypothetical protein